MSGEWNALRDRAEDLGEEHGKAGRKPYGDFGDLDEAGLMTAIGETAPATPDSQGRRMQLITAYHGGWCWGAGACFGCGAAVPSGGGDDVNGDLYCDACACEWA